MKKIFGYNYYLENINNDGEEVELFNEPDLLGDSIGEYELDVNFDNEEDIALINIKTETTAYRFEYFVDNDDEIKNGTEEPEVNYLIGFELDSESDDESLILDEDSNLYREVIKILIEKIRGNN